MPYDTDLVSHFIAVNECLQKIGGRAELDPENLGLKLRARGKYVELQPQFIFTKDDSVAYSPKLVEGAQDFCGWRPYFNRVWPLAISKLDFKTFCKEQGLPTPRHWFNQKEVDGTVILKKARSSFAQGISGPFTAADARAGAFSLAGGEYFEEFTPGQIAKIWYWGDSPLCLELRAMPSVVGDGKLNVLELAAKASLPFSPANMDALNAIAKMQGLKIDSVVPSGKTVIIDFLYTSMMHPVTVWIGNQNVLGKYVNSPLMERLKKAGKSFVQAMPEDIRHTTVYSIDAIVDAQDTAWFLEMNCNPVVHPDMYPSMFDGLFGDNSSAPKSN